MAERDDLRDGVSPETDELASELMGSAFDLLAAGEPFEVLLVVEGTDGAVSSYEFEDDGPEACLEGARNRVSTLDDAVRYAIAYEGAVEDEDVQVTIRLPTTVPIVGSVRGSARAGPVSCESS